MHTVTVILSNPYIETSHCSHIFHCPHILVETLVWPHVLYWRPNSYTNFTVKLYEKQTHLHGQHWWI